MRSSRRHLLIYALALIPGLSAVTHAQTSRPFPIVRIACVGDSITAGSGTRDPELAAYPSHLQRLLGPMFRVRNFGVSGATALGVSDNPYHKTQAFADAQAYKPDIVVLMLGTNDSKHPNPGSLGSEDAVNNWASKDRFLADYTALLAAFKAANPDVRLYVCPPVPAYPGRWGITDRTIRDEIGPLVRQAASATGATVLDLYAALSGKPELFPDTVHPNEAGAIAIAENVYTGLTGKPAPALIDADLPALLNRRVVFLGDSITQSGGYVTFIEYYLRKHRPADTIDIISVGLSSETWSGMSEKGHPFPRPSVLTRLADVLDKTRPATIVACYGMNDGAYQSPSAAQMDAFQQGARALIRHAKLARADVVLCTPPPFDVSRIKNAQTRPSPTTQGSSTEFVYGKPFAGYDDVLAEFGKWERSLPPNDVRWVVDFHSALNAFLAERRKTAPGFNLSKDGIHPSELGHLLMAYAFLSSVGITPPAGDPADELARLQTDPVYLLVKQRREARSTGWLEYIGYTRGKTVKTDSVAETEAKAAALEVQIRAALAPK